MNHCVPVWVRYRSRSPWWPVIIPTRLSAYRASQISFRRSLYSPCRDVSERDTLKNIFKAPFHKSDKLFFFKYEIWIVMYYGSLYTHQLVVVTWNLFLLLKYTCRAYMCVTFVKSITLSLIWSHPKKFRSIPFKCRFYYTCIDLEKITCSCRS